MSLNKNLPPQFIVLAIIAKHNALTISQLYSIIKNLKCNEISFERTTVKELIDDVNVLHVLGLIKEFNGVYTLTEKGKAVIEKVNQSIKCSSYV